MNNSYGIYREVEHRLMCFASEQDYHDFVKEENDERKVRFDSTDMQDKKGETTW